MQQGNVECNFSYGESMDLALGAWKSGKDMLGYVQTKEFDERPKLKIPTAI